MIDIFGGGDVTAYGTTTIRYNSDGSFLVSVELKVDFRIDDDDASFDDASFARDDDLGTYGGLVEITSGTTCDTTSPNFDETPFDDFDYDNWQYQFMWDENWYTQSSVSAFYVPAPDVYGPNPLGKAVLIRWGDDNSGFQAIGCGVLKEGPIPANVLTANIQKYPDYAGDITVTGTVTMTYSAAWSTGNPNDFVFAYDLQGVESNCEMCGIHVHAGTSCDDAEKVGGHYWDDNKVNNLWTRAGGAVYTGDGKGYFLLNNGFGYLENRYHVVIVHAQEGYRIGCGVLDFEKPTSFVYPI